MEVSLQVLQWLVNGFTVATFLVVVGFLMHWMRWSGAVDAKLENVVKSSNQAHIRLDQHIDGHP